MGPVVGGARGPSGVTLPQPPAGGAPTAPWTATYFHSATQRPGCLRGDPCVTPSPGHRATIRAIGLGLLQAERASGAGAPALRPPARQRPVARRSRVGVSQPDARLPSPGRGPPYRHHPVSLTPRQGAPLRHRKPPPTDLGSPNRPEGACRGPSPQAAGCLRHRKKVTSRCTVPRSWPPARPRPTTKPMRAERRHTPHARSANLTPTHPHSEQPPHSPTPPTRSPPPRPTPATGAGPGSRPGRRLPVPGSS